MANPWAWRRSDIKTRRINPNRRVDEECVQRLKRGNPAMPDKMARQFCAKQPPCEDVMNLHQFGQTWQPPMAPEFYVTGIYDEDGSEDDDDELACQDDDENILGPYLESANQPWTQRVPTDPDWPYDMPESYEDFPLLEDDDAC